MSTNIIKQISAKKQKFQCKKSKNFGVKKQKFWCKKLV